MQRKIGIITFHNSYNCGSMMETYAIQKYISNIGFEPEIINFSSNGQKTLYKPLPKIKNLKSLIKYFILAPHISRIKNNCLLYEEFKNKYFKLSKEYLNSEDIIDYYNSVIAGSDQIWNVTIADYDDAYFLNWVKTSKKIAYAPSFGAKNPNSYNCDLVHIKNWIKSFDYLSVREINGKKWIKDLTGRDASLMIDPTLLLSQKDYSKIEGPLDRWFYKNDYIFFYCPSFDKDTCSFVKKLSKKYKLPVIVWSTKSYYIRFVNKYGFRLVKEESPSLYLSYIKHSKLMITTSFHGTIFSTIYRKKFFVIKNGEMFGDDDRVRTLLSQLKLEERMISFEFDTSFDYLKDIDYSIYEIELLKLQSESLTYLSKALGI